MKSNKEIRLLQLQKITEDMELETDPVKLLQLEMAGRMVIQAMQTHD